MLSDIRNGKGVDSEEWWDTCNAGSSHSQMGLQPIPLHCNAIQLHSYLAGAQHCISSRSHNPTIPPKVIAVHWLFWNGILIMDDDHPQYIKDTVQPGTTPRKHQPTTPSVVPDVHAFLGIRSQRHLLPLLQQIVTSGTAGPQGFKSYQASAMNYFALDALTAKRANPVDALNPTYH